MNRIWSWAELCAEAGFQQALRTVNADIAAINLEFERAAPVMAAAALNGGTLTCVSCGAKTDARGALPCGH